MGIPPEMFVWVILAVSMYIYPLADAIDFESKRPISSYSYHILYAHYGFVLVSVLILLFPILFKLIFDYFPLDYLGFLIRLKSRPPFIREHIPAQGANVAASYLLTDYNEICINESKLISERVYRRSGVYLLSGTLIAFTGIGIFYSPLFLKSTSLSSNISERLVEYLPRFGALFFIEFIAFFFLRQFKIMHEEYRYYEAIKRKRQDNYNLLLLIEKYQDKPELTKTIVQLYTDNSNTGKLSKDETTQILETQRILNQETDVFGKIIELVKEVKSK